MGQTRAGALQPYPGNSECSRTLGKPQGCRGSLTATKLPLTGERLMVYTEKEGAALAHGREKSTHK